MPHYRRLFIPGSTVFLTAVVHQRRPLFAIPENVTRLRAAAWTVMRDWPFTFEAAAILPDHVHFLWTLPIGDVDYPKRMGRIKALFTKSLPPESSLRSAESSSRLGQHESSVWQRRYFEHTVSDDDDFKTRLDYIHFNPVKHGHTTCPHLWPNSSFAKWMARGEYEPQWGCVCDGRPVINVNYLDRVSGLAGE